MVVIGTVEPNIVVGSGAKKLLSLDIPILLLQKGL